MTVRSGCYGCPVPDEAAASHPTVRKVWVGGGYQATMWRRGTRHGIDVEIWPPICQTTIFHPWSES